MSCIATMKSMTYAMKAERILISQKIECQVIKVDPQLTKKGCSYGVQFSCEKLNDIYRLFREKNIDYGDLMGEYR